MSLSNVVLRKPVLKLLLRLSLPRLYLSRMVVSSPITLARLTDTRRTSSTKRERMTSSANPSSVLNLKVLIGEVLVMSSTTTSTFCGDDQRGETRSSKLVSAGLTIDLEALGISEALLSRGVLNFTD